MAIEASIFCHLFNISLANGGHIHPFLIKELWENQFFLSLIIVGYVFITIFVAHRAKHALRLDLLNN